MTRHERLVHLGDIVTIVKDWTITALFVLVAAFSGAVLGFTSFLFLLSLIGDIS